MAVGDVYRLTMYSNLLNNTLINTWAFQAKSSTQPSQADCEYLADNTMILYRAQQNPKVSWTTWELKELWGDGVTTVRDECRREGGNVYIGNFGEPNEGAGAVADLLPLQCACVLSLQTGVAGRRRRGRSYMFGISETVQVDSQWVSTFLTNMAGQAAAFMAKFGPAGTDPNFQVGVWSERTASGCVPNPSAKGLINIETPHPELAFTPLTGIAVRPVVYSQRRRTLGVGR